MVPGLHLLEALSELGAGPESVVWFGAGRAIEERVLREAPGRLPGVSIERRVLRLEPAGGGAPTKAGLVTRLPAAIWRARAALAAARVDVVIGLGGFVSAPVVLAAKSLGLPTLLLEVNAVAGAATRRLGRIADRVAHARASSVPDGELGGRHVVTGAPLGPRFAPDASAESADGARGYKFDPARPLLCVLGGSQGALGVNRFVAEHAPDLAAGGLAVLHQTGPGRLDEGAARIAGAVEAVEFLDDVPGVLRASRLVLARGGASTLAELAALRVPTVVVPYPHHKDGHQRLNARALGEGVRIVSEADLGAATVPGLVELAGERGAAERERMRSALAAAEDGRGAQRVARLVLELAGREADAGSRGVEVRNHEACSEGVSRGI